MARNVLAKGGDSVFQPLFLKKKANNAGSPGFVRAKSVLFSS